MTKQHAVELAWKQIHKQKGFARTEVGSCVMRTKDGKRCAQGALLPAEKWKVEQEVAGIKQLEEITGLSRITTGFSRACCFLADLQGCHDDSTSLKEFDAKIALLCEKYDLKMPKKKG
jgi:hypothetical protein